MSSAIYLIARNELSRVVSHPLAIVVGLILLVLAFINSAGGILELQYDGFLRGYMQTYFVTIFICSTMAAFLGVTSMSEERRSNSINVLLAKPLYRKNIIIGKFIGLSIFMLIFLIMIMLANTLMLLYFYGPPLSFYELFLRVTAYTLSLWLECSLTFALMLFVGTLFKDDLLAVSVAITYISFVFFWSNITNLVAFIINIPFTPELLTFYMISDVFGKYGLFNTNVPFSAWFSYAAPYVILMILLVLAVLLADCFVISKTEDA